MNNIDGPVDQDLVNEDTTYSETDDGLKHQKAKPPSVLGEADVFSGDVPEEPADIDEELAKVGLVGDDEDGIKPLGIRDELDDEVQ